MPVTESPTAVAVQDNTQVDDPRLILFWNFALLCCILFCTFFQFLLLLLLLFYWKKKD